MKHTNPLPFALGAAALGLALPASADYYGGVDLGSASMSESGAFGVPLAGFGGPTVDHDLCGGTAVITVGAEPSVTRIDASGSLYRLFVGMRREAWGVELGMFNVARLQGSATAGPYAVAQPTCNPVPTTPITVSAEGLQLDTVAFDGYSITPVYSWEFAEGWTLDLRATVAFWDREDRSQWQIVVTELQGGNPLQTYPTAWVNGQGGGSGTDLWPGLGVSYEFKENLRLRGLVEREKFGDLSTTSWTLGLAIDFD